MSLSLSLHINIYKQHPPSPLAAPRSRGGVREQAGAGVMGWKASTDSCCVLEVEQTGLGNVLDMRVGDGDGAFSCLGCVKWGSLRPAG